MIPSPEEFIACLSKTAAKIDAFLIPRLHPQDPNDPNLPLYTAMRYAATTGGKRFRAFLVIQSAALFQLPEAQALHTAAAIECIHTYSLIHDDLPAMDNADLRRGKPSAHRAFDEATALLAGDALQTLAFEILAHPATHSDPSVRCRLIQCLAKSAGVEGMAGGQMMDMQATQIRSDYSQILKLQQRKTGALIACACVSGGILADAEPSHLQRLEAYAHDLGLAFQMQDDILDAAGDSKETGKACGQDAQSGKITFVHLLGLEEARQQAAKVTERARNHLAIFGERARWLCAAADFSTSRRS